MALPDYQNLMLPLLECAANKDEVRTSNCAEEIAEKLSLSKEEMEELLPSGKQTVLNNRVHWARSYMVKAGLVEPTRRGYIRITSRGRKLLADSPDKIDNETLAQFPGFVEWKEQSSSNNNKETQSLEAASADLTPEETIERSSLILDRQLQKEILDCIAETSPAFFERLIVDLLISMGYGAGRAEMGQSLGRSNDGGVDGIIKEDELGLDVVYIQAKRYAPSNTVGRPDIQAFVGSIEGFGASKGVFVTTSSFSSTAQDYISKIRKRIILIDGQELSKLMIRHDVGVRTKEIYKVKKIDEDYFAEE